jgi:uncharacterized protein YprB with RNaseH-like and TPR domain
VTLPTAAPPSDLAHRLARFRAANPGPGTNADPLPHRRIRGDELAERLATTLDGEVVSTANGRYVRVDGGTADIALDRERLAALPDHPPAQRPLICLDTETTGLATAAGTVAFLIGLGWWEGPRFRQVQLLLPDHGDEPALLDELGRHIPADAWLVTYNGRGFDWPLLVTRYRMTRRSAPTHAGHLDLLPLVRRLFRHRMDDARLQTAERTLLGGVRHDDVDGWEIPGRYLGFLRGGPAEPLRAVVRHNDEDVRSLARLLALLDAGYGSEAGRRRAPAGDLAGLARAYSQVQRHADALACLDLAISREAHDARPEARVVAADPDDDAWPRPGADAVPWWSPRALADFGGRPPRNEPSPSAWRQAASLATPWDHARIVIERARLLRRLGRFADAEDNWQELADGTGRHAVRAWIEIAKLREHRLGDPFGALDAAEHGWSAVERRRRLGRPEPLLETDLRRRLVRLRRRVARRVRGPAQLSVERGNGTRGSRVSPLQRACT